MKAGDIVICVDNEGSESLITVGKRYTIWAVHIETIKIVDDAAITRWYNKNRFKINNEKIESDEVIPSYIPIGEILEAYKAAAGRHRPTLAWVINHFGYKIITVEHVKLEKIE